MRKLEKQRQTGRRRHVEFVLRPRNVKVEALFVMAVHKHSCRVLQANVHRGGHNAPGCSGRLACVVGRSCLPVTRTRRARRSKPSLRTCTKRSGVHRDRLKAHPSAPPACFTTCRRGCGRGVGGGGCGRGGCGGCGGSLSPLSCVAARVICVECHATLRRQRDDGISSDADPCACHAIQESTRVKLCMLWVNKVNRLAIDNTLLVCKVLQEPRRMCCATRCIHHHHRFTITITTNGPCLTPPLHPHASPQDFVAAEE